MFPLPNQLGLGSTTLPEVPASETPASFNFNISSKAKDLIKQIAISPNKETMMPLLNQLMRDRTINKELKNHILSSLQERDINVVRQRFKQLSVDLHQSARTAPPAFDVGDGPSLPVVPVSETPASFNADLLDPRPVVEAQPAKRSHLIVPEPLRPRVRQPQPIQKGPITEGQRMPQKELEEFLKGGALQVQARWHPSQLSWSDRSHWEAKYKDLDVGTGFDGYPVIRTSRGVVSLITLPISERKAFHAELGVSTDSQGLPIDTPPSQLSWSDRRNWKAKYEALGVETDQHGNARIPIPEEEMGRVYTQGPEATRRAIEKRKAFHAELGILTDDQGYPIDDPATDVVDPIKTIVQKVESADAKGSSKTPYIIGGAILLSAVGGYFIWKNRQS